MLQTLQAVDATEYEERAIAETPFNEAPVYESQEEPLRETSISEARGGFSESWELQTPFISPEAMEAGEAGSAPSAEVASLAELASELKDSEFREALDQLAGEYGDRESRDLAAERLLNEHFQPLAAQTEAMLDRFLGRVEGYETE